jgi:hypothetical protein
MPDLDKTGSPSNGSRGSRGPELDDPSMHGLGVDDEGNEAKYIRQRLSSRFLSRVAPAVMVRDPGPDVVGDKKHAGGSDDGGSGVGIAAGLSVGWNGEERRNGHHRGGLRYGRRQSDVVRYYREVGPVLGVLANDTNVYLDLGQVSTEKVWEMRSMIVLDNDPWTAGSGGELCASFSGHFYPNNGVSIVDLMSPGLALPLSLTWSHDQQLVFGGQTLYAVIHTPVAGHNYFAMATMMEYDWEAYRTRL